MRFEYERYFVRFGDEQRLEIRRPVVHARIGGPARYVDLRCLVDTGADFTLFPRSLADKLGIPVDDSASHSVFGIGGSPIPAAAGDVDIELSDGVEVSRWRASALFVTFPHPADQQTLSGIAGS